MDSSAIPALHLWLHLQDDPEAAARLREIIREILNRKGNTLWLQGDWQEALLVFAEAAGAADPKADVERRRREAKIELLKVIPTEIPAHRTCSGFLTSSTFCAIEEEVRSTLPWGIPALLDMLGDRSNGVAQENTFVVLRGLGDDVVPALCRATSSRNQDLRYYSCVVLSTSRHPSTHLVRTLRDACSRSDASEDLRELGRRSLPRLEFLLDCAPPTASR